MTENTNKALFCFVYLSYMSNTNANVQWTYEMSIGHVTVHWIQWTTKMSIGHVRVQWTY
jgi:hypothetical protein